LSCIGNNLFRSSKGIFYTDNVIYITSIAVVSSPNASLLLSNTPLKTFTTIYTSKCLRACVIECHANALALAGCLLFPSCKQRDKAGMSLSKFCITIPTDAKGQTAGANGQLSLRQAKDAHI